MASLLPWFIAIGPLALAVAGSTAGANNDRSTRLTLLTAMAAAGLAFLAALAAAAAVLFTGPVATPTLGGSGVGFGIYLDRLSAPMLVLVAFIGAVVVNYSRNYLDGDPGQARFVRRLCLTLAAVLLLIMSGNMFQFVLAWIGTSLGLHGLLIFYPERPAAHLAARKKFVASRIGDLCVIAAMCLIYRAVGTLDYQTIFAQVRALPHGAFMNGPLSAAPILLAVAAMLKSAQFPLYGWLLEVMETPTPVSALLHAGVINAGGFLVLRFAPLIAASAPSLAILAIVGGFTALFGSTVMLTQTSIKVSLAYSTIAQMGFMMLECGLGAFSAAFLHIAAHSLYKAHAFLSSGGVVAGARADRLTGPAKATPAAQKNFVAAGALFVTLAACGAILSSRTANPGIVVLTAIMALGLVLLIGNSIDGRPGVSVVAWTLAVAIATGAAYFGLQFLSERLLGAALPVPAPAPDGLRTAIAILAVGSFAALTLFQSLVARHGCDPRWQALYAPVSNGLYINTLVNRWVTQFWPSPPRRGFQAGLAPIAGAQP